MRGNLSTSDGEIAVNWALDGHSILMRAEWDIAKYLPSGRLVQVLENYRTPPAGIHAVYPQRHQLSGRVRTFVDFLAGRFGEGAGAGRPMLSRGFWVGCLGLVRAECGPSSVVRHRLVSTTLRS